QRHLVLPEPGTQAVAGGAQVPGRPARVADGAGQLVQGRLGVEADREGLFPGHGASFRPRGSAPPPEMQAGSWRTAGRGRGCGAKVLRSPGRGTMTAGGETAPPSRS